MPYLSLKKKKQNQDIKIFLKGWNESGNTQNFN